MTRSGILTLAVSTFKLVLNKKGEERPITKMNWFNQLLLGVPSPL